MGLIAAHNVNDTGCFFLKVMLSVVMLNVIIPSALEPKNELTVPKNDLVSILASIEKIYNHN